MLLATMDLTAPDAWALGVCCLLSALAGWMLRRGLRQRRLRVQVRRSQLAEQRAHDLLRSAGFWVYDQQVTRRYPFRVDGRRQLATVRADLLARRGRRRYVVEVKTGMVARPTLATTRRQLLEYRLAFGVDGVMLADLERGRLHRVDFSWARQWRWSWLGLAALLGLLLGGLLSHAYRAFVAVNPPQCTVPQPSTEPRTGGD